MHVSSCTPVSLVLSVHLSISVSLFVFLSVSLSLYLSLCLSVSISGSPFLSLFLLLCFSVSWKDRARALSLSLSLSLCLSLSLSLTHTHSASVEPLNDITRFPGRFFLVVCLSLSLFLYTSLSHTRTHAHTHTLSLSLSLFSHTHRHTHTHSLSLTHTHTHTNMNIRTNLRPVERDIVQTGQQIDAHTAQDTDPSRRRQEFATRSWPLQCAARPPIRSPQKLVMQSPRHAGATPHFAGTSAGRAVLSRLRGVSRRPLPIKGRSARSTAGGFPSAPSDYARALAERVRCNHMQFFPSSLPH